VAGQQNHRRHRHPCRQTVFAHRFRRDLPTRRGGPGQHQATARGAADLPSQPWHAGHGLGLDTACEDDPSGTLDAVLSASRRAGSVNSLRHRRRVHPARCSAIRSTPGFDGSGRGGRGAEFSSDHLHRSSAMKRVIALARRVAARSIPVLIEGESGTGKELMARAIHQASPRADKPFIAVNCGAVPAGTRRVRIFRSPTRRVSPARSSDRKGHFERANGGTIFLDEIGELPKAIQVKLLRTLQEGEVTPGRVQRTQKDRCPRRRRHQPDVDQRSRRRQFS
jgi:hypothetical protein